MRLPKNTKLEFGDVVYVENTMRDPYRGLIFPYGYLAIYYSHTKTTYCGFTEHWIQSDIDVISYVNTFETLTLISKGDFKKEVTQ